jgi:hypothetical protein
MPFDIAKLDLSIAWRRVKADLSNARVFVHSPHEVDLIEAGLQEWLDQVREKIASGYRPHSAFIADIPKGNGAVRPAALLTLEDRLLYASLVGALLPAINAGLSWSQGKIDFAYRLSERPHRVEWFTNAYNGWSAFRNSSIERISNGAQFVALTDITGFYENVDLPILLSDLRALGCDNEVLQLLQSCLFRWAVVPGRGLPQGQSPSDILSKVYLNPIDRTMIDRGIDYVRYVDDIRIFCDDQPECKRALMLLAQGLRRRGLNLQSAKTDIVTAELAQNKIEGVAPVIRAVQARYLDSLREFFIDINPSIPISELEMKVDAEDAPLDVVRAVLQEHFIDRPGSFNKTLFHYVLNRLGAQKDPFAIEYCLAQLTEHPEETDAILHYVYSVEAFEEAFDAIRAFLTSESAIYDFQNYQIFYWLSSLELELPDELIAAARKVNLDHSHPAFLRAATRALLERHGTFADFEHLEGSYPTFHEDLERAQVLVSIKRMEAGRRNSFYGRVAGDGLLCQRAIRLVKEGRL